MNLHKAFIEMNKLHESYTSEKETTETTFSEPRNRDFHHRMHTIPDPMMIGDKDMLPYMSVEEYEKRADELSRLPVSSSDINCDDPVVGFITNKGRVVKYDKDTQEMVVYKADKNDSTLISYYKASPGSYVRKLKKYYDRDVTEDVDLYNMPSSYLS